MEENLFDIALLLGCSSTLDKLGSGTLSFSLAINQNHSVFFVSFIKALQLLQQVCEPDWLHEKLYISKYFIEMLMVDKVIRGFCNICGKYLCELRDHLKYTHSLTVEQANAHAEMFTKSDYVFMPADFKFVANMSGFSNVKPKNGNSGSQVIKKKKNSSEGHAESKTVEVHVEEDSGNTETDFESVGSIVCDECGKRVPIEKQKAHSTYHRRYKVIECPNCAKELKKRYLTKHLKTCIDTYQEE